MMCETCDKREPEPGFRNCMVCLCEAMGTSRELTPAERRRRKVQTANRRSAARAIKRQRMQFIQLRKIP